ncbi:formate--phosphoribosylaminoimidazolecarboxamide ligase [Candidatus Micrarchaeota archaeon]|nr:formate--phosphoribosylaminoimidazolecarboxamide ligase [Candidatus Micrarchaeota archaeon]
MLPKEKIKEILDSYDKSKVTIATICSHSSLQIFHGAKQEGFKTIGIVKEEYKKFYESFPNACPDEFIVVKDYSDFPTEELIERNSVIVPHGSFVEYINKKLDDLEIPIFGNRGSLRYERNRHRMFKWMESSKLRIPKILKPEEIDRPVVVKFPGAKGGRGYLVVNSYDEFMEKVGPDVDCLIQEFIIGVRAYIHYFFSPFNTGIGYQTKNGTIEMLSIDRRRESNADEIYRTLSIGAKGPKTRMSFTVIGNDPIVLRESLLPRFMDMGAEISDTSFDLFGGLYGPFCIETVIADDLDIFAFEISARIVAGTNLYPSGSPYSVYYYDAPMSTGRRIAKEIRTGIRLKGLDKIIY